jgi:hypothetical protein
MSERIGKQRALAGAVFACGLLAGCFGRGAEPKRAGSALWLTADSAELTRAEQAELALAGLTEVYLDGGEIEWNGLPVLRRLALGKVPSRTPATLVVSGAWLPGEREPLEVAGALESELQALRIEAEQAGLLVVGFHFDISPGERAEHFAKTLAALRRKLRGKAYLSVGLARRDLAGEAAKKIAASCDFVSSFVYGQMPGEPEDPEAWDLQEVEKTFHRLEALGKPYLTGVITVGAATLLQGGKTAATVTTRMSLGELVANRRLELRPGFSLQGVDRQLFEFVAVEPTTAGGLALARGDAVRVVRTATPLVEELRRQTGAWESPLRLGDLYYRLPGAEERLSLTARNFATVLGPGSSEPQLALALERKTAAPKRWLLTARLENRSSEASDLAYFDSNYLEVAVQGAVIIDADPGDFRRVDLFHDGERGTMQALRAANQARFYLPLLEGHQSARTGEIELRFEEGEPSALISASFLLPDGHVLATQPIAWSFPDP